MDFSVKQYIDNINRLYVTGNAREHSYRGDLQRFLESEKTDDLITSYPIGGSNIVGKPIFKDGKVYINETQYFDHVPELAWNFYIGGYKPGQKWLIDRKDSEIDFDDALHYQKMIVALIKQIG